MMARPVKGEASPEKGSDPFSPLVGCRTVEEIEQNLADLDVALSTEETAWLELRRDQKP